VRRNSISGEDQNIVCAMAAVADAPADMKPTAEHAELGCFAGVKLRASDIHGETAEAQSVRMRLDDSLDKPVDHRGAGSRLMPRIVRGPGKTVNR
jgi:type II secretory ATPase GspE/PulE/Tfp pilus assembly ATPase PilB-like protein